MPGRVVAVAAVAGGSLLAQCAGDAAVTSRAAPAGMDAGLVAADSHVTLARLEARAAKLSRQYRGQLEMLAGAEADAKVATARARWARHQLGLSRHQMAKLAVASYVSGGTDQTLRALFSGDTRRIMDRSAIISYLARRHSARQQALRLLMLASDSADRAAAAKIARLRRMIAALVQQKQKVERL